MLISTELLVQANFGCVNADKEKKKTTANKQTKTMSNNTINVKQE